MPRDGLLATIRRRLAVPVQGDGAKRRRSLVVAAHGDAQ
jgi:hypothetical protein